MELKLRFIFIISCWPGGPTPYRIRRCPDWGYLGADKFERGLSQVPGPTRIRPFLITSKIVLRDFYVDDVLTGADSLETALQIRKELTTILQQAGFELILSGTERRHSNCAQIRNRSQVIRRVA
jgi:hypothetical protein